MLPIRLELRNFLAYMSPASIQFEGVHLACLSGPNGAGKSSLLDAMTWVLWGHARGRGDEDLIHMGQDEMRVIFEFEQDGERYRVQRDRNRNGRGRLTLFKFDPKVNEFCLISTGESIRDTQDQITRILRLDYDTFVYSAFIQQGKADAFTTAKPAQRKETLGKILRLSDWEDYEGRVKVRLDGIKLELGNHNALIDEYEQKEQDEPQLLRDLETAGIQLEETLRSRESAEIRLNEVAGASETLNQAKTQLEGATRRVKQAQEALTALEGNIERQEARRAEYEQILANRDHIEQNHALLEQARQISMEQGDKLIRLSDVEKQLNLAQRALDESRSKLQREIERYTERIAKVEGGIEAAQGAETELAPIEEELGALDQHAAAANEWRKRIDQLINESAQLDARNKELTRERDRLRNHLRLIRGAEAICPVCHQPLGEEHRGALEAEYTQAGIACKDETGANELRIADNEQEIAGLRAQIEQITRDMRRRDALNNDLGALRKQVDEGQQAELELARAREELSALQQILETENYGAEARAEIVGLQSEIEALGYDKEAYAEAKQALNRLREFDKFKQDLEIADRSLPDIDENLRTLRIQRESKTQDLEREGAEVDQWKAQIAELEIRVQEQKTRQLEVNKRRIEERNASEKLNDVRNKLTAIQGARQRKQELVIRRDALRQDEAVYKELREAFGKNGVPAMIIEAAIPELENATNRLLTRMTDGRMHVRFDMQRENKTGGISETFDIKISDELGERDYETYSGGEGFRINFALRIALSQFLAHRAGAKLQTLVIDEGFGSQDSIGRERLVEAINAISDDFDLVLVVTHIEELRDQFPVRIEVNKTERGSVVSIR